MSWGYRITICEAKISYWFRLCSVFLIAHIFIVCAVELYWIAAALTEEKKEEEEGDAAAEKKRKER